MNRKPRPKPTMGDATIGMTTFCTTACQLTCPLDAIAAPQRPPISAWVDDDGNPNRHTMTFQIMAPTMAANKTVSPSAAFGVAMMLPTVLATLVDTSAPAKLHTAASASATRGRNALVEIGMAIALAASLKPLVKSKPRA